MILSAHQKRRLRTSLRLIVFGVSAGLFFVILNDGVREMFPLVNGAIIGFFIAVVVSVFELYIYESNIRKHPFIVILFTRSFYYLILIIFIFISEIGIARMIKEELDLPGLFQNEAFNQYIYGGELMVSASYTFALIIIISFSRQISRKLGHGVFIGLITGRNHQPRELEKVFMFVNIPASHEIIEQIGRLEFHRFINEMAYDVTLPVIKNHGIIYQYVEDEMVLTWNMKTGIQDANAIRCFFDIRQEFRAKREKYLERFGVAPEINGALHCGVVVKGEIGSIKTEIVYHGDTMNTTSRILDACADLHKEFLVSASFLELVDLPEEYQTQKCGKIKLKGKKEAIELYEVNQVGSTQSIKN
jgi:adenylate cyclase